MEDLDLRALRKELENQLALLSQQTEQGELNSDEAAVINPDRADLALKYDQRERSIVLGTQVEKQIREIKAGLKRIEEGIYGACVECGDTIAADRLKALPYASLCIRCQEDLEKK